MTTPGRGDPRPVGRTSVSSGEPDEAFEVMRAAYTDHRPTLYGDRDGFEFRMDITSVGPLQMTRMRHSMGFVAPSAPADRLIVMTPVDGTTMRVTCRGEQTADPVMLAPTWASFTGQWDSMTLDTVNLDLGFVAGHAEHLCGIRPDELAFADLRPVSVAMADHWHATVAHVRDDVLADPFARNSPMILDSSLRSLAGAALATFPNTGLERASDPEQPAPRGDVPVPALREVVEYLRTFAGTTVGPADITDLAGAPAREIVAGLRRRYGTHPARLLWQARLRGVRRDLREADPGPESDERDTVAAVAARWGFTRTGAFEVAYARAFGGETPAQTLRRSR